MSYLNRITLTFWKLESFLKASRILKNKQESKWISLLKARRFWKKKGHKKKLYILLQYRNINNLRGGLWLDGSIYIYLVLFKDWEGKELGRQYY